MLEEKHKFEEKTRKSFTRGTVSGVVVMLLIEHLIGQLELPRSDWTIGLDRKSDWTIGTTKIPGSVYTKSVRKCPDPPPRSPILYISDRRVGGGAGLRDYIDP